MINDSIIYIIRGLSRYSGNTLQQNVHDFIELISILDQKNYVDFGDFWDWKKMSDTFYSVYFLWKLGYYWLHFYYFSYRMGIQRATTMKKRVRTVDLSVYIHVSLFFSSHIISKTEISTISVILTDNVDNMNFGASSQPPALQYREWDLIIIRIQ